MTPLKCMAGLILLSFAFCMIAGCLDTGTTTVKNITISEKYPKHTYRGMCATGKVMVPCDLQDSGIVIDTERNLYNVGNDNLWAKFEINKTYQVGYINSGNEKYIQGMGFGGNPI